MKVLVIGNGGREHALCWSISKSPLCEKLYCIPGNAGIQEEAECINIKIENFNSLKKFIKKNQINFEILYLSRIKSPMRGFFDSSIVIVYVLDVHVIF